MKFSAPGWLYGKIANLRNSLYKKGVFKSYALGSKTVSIGNITVGGTGKTPLVAFVAEILAAKGEKVCILTRGYGRNNPKERVLVSDENELLADFKSAGDEPFELANKLLGKAIVISDANRVAAAAWAREKFNVTAFVLDDAFQHQRAVRDLNIVLMDATNPFGNHKVLPSGILREPLENLKRADAIVISRTNLIGEKEISDLKSQISIYNSSSPIFTSGNEVTEINEINEINPKPKAQSPKPKEKIQNLEPKIQNPEAKSKIQNQKSKIQTGLAFCALGNPDNFFEQLRRENFNLVAVKKYPDHHFYTQKDIEKLHLEAERSGAQIFLTTAKDAVKLTDLQFRLPCYIVQNRLFFDDGINFVKLIENL